MQSKRPKATKKLLTYASMAAVEEKMFSKVTDSGAPRAEFDTGAVRDAASGKGRFDLIPMYVLKRLAVHYENGARKYADRNWEKGIPLHRYVDSAFRHLAAFMDGDRTEDHLAAILWNVAGYVWTEREIREGRLPATLQTVPWSDSLNGRGKNPRRGAKRNTPDTIRLAHWPATRYSHQ